MTVAVGQARPRASHSRPRAPHTRTIVLGYLTIVVGFLFPIITSKFEAIVFLGPFMAIALLMAALAWRFGTWAKILATVVAILMLLANAPFMAEAVAHPSVFFDFVPSMLIIAGAVIAAAGGVAAVVRRADPRTQASDGERTIRRASIALVILVAAISAALSIAGRTTLSAAEKVGATQVGLRNFSFQPQSFEATSAGPARIVVHNSDVALHTFTVDALGVDVGVPPGSDVAVDLGAAAPGTYQVYCRPHSEVQPDGTRQGMTASLVVR